MLLVFIPEPSQPVLLHVLRMSIPAPHSDWSMKLVSWERLMHQSGFLTRESILNPSKYGRTKPSVKVKLVSKGNFSITSKY
jgi:hypothetical protein